jgi:hypothetical protein
MSMWAISSCARHILLAAGLLMLSVPAHAEPGCALEIRRADAPSMTVDPFDRRQQSALITVEVFNAGSEPCDAVIELSDPVAGQSGQSWRQGIGLEFFERSPTTAASTGSLAVQSARVNPGTSRTFKFTPQLSLRGAPLRGERSFELTAEILGGGSEARLSRVSFDLDVEVVAATSLTIAGMSADRTLHLGDLRAGAVGTATLYAQSNGPFRINVTSQNRGKLKHEDDPKLEGVAYQVIAEGGTSNLAQPLSIFFEGPTALLGKRLDLTVRTPNAPLLFAGTYKDVIEVEITPY